MGNCVALTNIISIGAGSNQTITVDDISKYRYIYYAIVEDSEESKHKVPTFIPVELFRLGIVSEVLLTNSYVSQYFLALLLTYVSDTEIKISTGSSNTATIMTKIYGIK